MIKFLKSAIKRDKEVLLIIFGIFAFKLILIVGFNNTGWEPDSYQHLNELNTIYANFPQNLGLGLGVWTKPLYAYTFGLIPALFGYTSLAVFQILNSLIFCLIAYLAYKLVVEISKSKRVGILAAALVMVSVTLFISSVTSLTEPIFALFLILGFYSFYRQRVLLAALFFGFSILGRIEGIFFVAIFLFAIFVLKIFDAKRVTISWRKFGAAALLSILPVFIWNFLGYLQTGSALFIFSKGYPANSVEIYGQGSFLYYPVKFAAGETVVSFLMLLAISYGVFSLTKFWRKNDYSLTSLHDFLFDKNRFFIILAGGSALLFILSQVITWRFGLLGSAGLMRYFVSVLPLMIIVSSIGLFYFLNDLKFKKSRANLFLVLLVIVSQIIVTLVNFIGVGPVSSKWIKPVTQELVLAGEWMAANVSPETFAATPRPEVLYYAKRTMENSTIVPTHPLFQGKRGIYVWDDEWSMAIFNLTLENYEENAEFVTDFGGRVKIFQIQ